MTICNIDSPIEQRHTDKGNPNAILQFGSSLSERQRRLLDGLPTFRSSLCVAKKSVSMSDLSALTAETGVEYALFTKGNVRLIFRGNSCTVDVDEAAADNLSKIGYRWSGHTHPGADLQSMFASDGDYHILSRFRQERSVVYNSKGQFLTFDQRR